SYAVLRWRRGEPRAPFRWALIAGLFALSYLPSVADYGSGRHQLFLGPLLTAASISLYLGERAWASLRRPASRLLVRTGVLAALAWMWLGAHVQVTEYVERNTRLYRAVAAQLAPHDLSRVSHIALVRDGHRHRERLPNG